MSEIRIDYASFWKKKVSEKSGQKSHRARNRLDLHAIALSTLKGRCRDLVGWSVNRARPYVVVCRDCVRESGAGVSLGLLTLEFTHLATARTGREVASCHRHHHHWVSPREGGGPFVSRAVAAATKRFRFNHHRRFGTRVVNENRSRIIWVRGHQSRWTLAEFKWVIWSTRSDQSIANARPVDVRWLRFRDNRNRSCRVSQSSLAGRRVSYRHLFFPCGQCALWIIDPARQTGAAIISRKRQ